MLKNYRTAHWVGHSLLKELQEKIGDYLEDNLTRKLIDASNPDDLAVAEDENSNEADTSLQWLSLTMRKNLY